MGGETLHSLGDDQPKTNPWQHDALGHAPFAKYIARAIINMSAPNGYVLGLQGPWGSGKSTIINFIAAHIDKHNQEHPDHPIVHIDFKPWIVPEHQDLIAAFFKVLSEAINSQGMRQEQRYRSFAKAADALTTHTAEAAAKLSIAAVSGAGLPSDASTMVGWVVKIIPFLAKRSLKKYLEEPSLQKVYADLRASLKNESRKYLVSIDDLDRLSAKDIRLMMQLVKTLGQLPNIIYLLSYDRAIVWPALDRSSKNGAPNFAEKIIQHELTVPTPSPNSLLNLLQSDLKVVFGSEFDQARSTVIYRYGIKRWLRSPRDVVRLSNAVKFAWPAVSPEVDPLDLLAIEGLRLFEPQAFNWIRDNRGLFFENGSQSSDDERLFKDAVLQLEKTISHARQNHVRWILACLFPKSAARLCEEYVVEEACGRTIQRRGIGCEAGYDTYFSQQISKDFVPKAILQTIVEKANDSIYIDEIIKNYIGRINSYGKPMILQLMQELTDIQSEVSEGTFYYPFFLSLVRHGADIIKLGYLYPESNLKLAYQNLTYSSLYALESGQRDWLLCSIYLNEEYPEALSAIYLTLRKPTSKINFEAQVGELLLKQIKTAAADGTLKVTATYSDILGVWRELGGQDEAKTWLNDAICDAEILSKVARDLLCSENKGGRTTLKFAERPPSEIYDLARLYGAATNHLIDPELSADQQMLFSSLVREAEILFKRDRDATLQTTNHSPH
jgi:virulence-associated protein VapD